MCVLADALRGIHGSLRATRAGSGRVGRRRPARTGRDAPRSLAIQAASARCRTGDGCGSRPAAADSRARAVSRETCSQERDTHCGQRRRDRLGAARAALGVPRAAGRDRRPRLRSHGGSADSRRGDPAGAHRLDGADRRGRAANAARRRGAIRARPAPFRSARRARDAGVRAAGSRPPGRPRRHSRSTTATSASKSRGRAP